MDGTVNSKSHPESQIFGFGLCDTKFETVTAYGNLNLGLIRKPILCNPDYLDRGGV